MGKIIKRPATLIEQGQLTLCSTFLKGSDLLIPNFYSVETLYGNNDNDIAYQRVLNRAQANGFAKNLINDLETKNAFPLGTIFMATDKAIDFDVVTSTIFLNIDKTCPLSVVDGLHKIEGLKIASEKNKKVLDLDVHVIIALNLSKIDEKIIYTIINSTFK